jgi:hypothetical protein
MPLRAADRFAMDERQQRQGGAPPCAGRRWPLRSWGGTGAFLFMAAFAALADSASAQLFRLGPFDFTAVGNVDIGYESNVDGLGVEESGDLSRSDFYWMPGITINSSREAMRPSSSIGLSAAIAYQDYFKRNEMDTALYNIAADFQATHPRISLGGMASAVYSIDSMEHEYVPGGTKRDPNLVQMANINATWNYRRLQLNGASSFTQTRHDFDEFKTDDSDEKTATWGANLTVASWGSLFYTWDWSDTYNLFTDEQTTETTESFGLSGSIPFELLRRPQISYSIGFSHETTVNADGTEESTWEPTHSITVQDAFQLSKSINLSAAATWNKTVSDDTVTFQYNVALSQSLGPRAQHALTFTQEPRPTFGSTSDTETTTYGYSFGMSDVIFRGVGLSFGATYDQSTPLGDPTALTENTTSVNFGVNHSKQFSRRLSRNLSYAYTWEDSNLVETDPVITHTVLYGFSYQF